jgi:hypothetical protein
MRWRAAWGRRPADACRPEGDITANLFYFSSVQNILSFRALCLVLGGVAIGLAAWVITPTRVTLGKATYVVPRKNQFAPSFHNNGEIALVLHGSDLADHIPGFHASLPAWQSGATFEADTPVVFTSSDDFEARRLWQSESLKNAPFDGDTSVPLVTLDHQKALRPGCYKMGKPSRVEKACLFTYADGDFTVQFWLQGANIPYAPKVARYAVVSLEHFRKR